MDDGGGSISSKKSRKWILAINTSKHKQKETLNSAAQRTWRSNAQTSGNNTLEVCRVRAPE